MMKSVMDIDGGVLEGGGQILRMAMVLSVLKKIPIRVYNIRAGRRSPGIRPQHLGGIQLVQNMCSGKLRLAEIGSTEIEFSPEQIRSGNFYADTQTAGSIGLLIQVSLPCALFGNDVTVLKLRGGTNAELAPQFDFTTEIFRPLLERFGASFDYKILKRGYFPKGGGEVHLRIKPVQELKAIELINAGKLTRIWGWSFVAGTIPLKDAQMMAQSAQQSLKRRFDIQADIKVYTEDPSIADQNGSGIILVAQTDTGCLLGGSALGYKRMTAEEVGIKAADEIIEAVEFGACVDEYSQDQIILLMALAKGKSIVRTGPITMHTETAIYIAELMTKVKFNIIEDGISRIIECEGIGFKNPN